MKIRTGFVSNSSTTTYICDVCGNVVAEEYIWLDDANMLTCRDGHTICENHSKIMSLSPKEKLACMCEAMTTPVVMSMLKDDEADDGVINSIWDSEFNRQFREGIPTELCPICTMKSIRKEDILRYLLKKNGLEANDVRVEMRNKFKTHSDFKSYKKEK